MPPPYRTIFDARNLARDLHARSEAFADRDGARKLADAAKAIWTAISTLEAVPPRRKAGEARTQRSLQRAVRDAARDLRWS